ncbi:MAG: C45 family autoproteolytic acyltransferase/hydrolase [Candidatus Aminicenantes bacterium]
MVDVKFFFLTLFLIIASCILFAGDTQLQLPNSGFETLDAGGFPVHWRIESKISAPGIQVKIDNQYAHSGEKSLQISHNQWGRSVLVSEPLTLKVGELYRLRGWVKTGSAVSWPTDRYPTSMAACLTMESFPFTNHSPSVGASTDWKPIETLFIATRSQDRVRLHLGYNGNAKGDVWFDDVQVQKVENILGYIPMETVKWFGPAFRYEDKGWIFLHIEGKPYQRGYQFGYLLADEIAAYMNKLAVQANEDNPAAGWWRMRQITDALMLRKYDEEYLVEMKGIADGAAKAGAQFEEHAVDFIDIVTINSVIDLGQVWSALRRTPHALSGRNFLAAEDELNIPIGEHKCSGFLANGPAAKNGDLVFGQIFMWYGYTGVHWNVICDVVPDKGHRLVYETFPGGIHSGADFYLNASGIMIGETTVRQTPFDIDGTPQSNRIRKAAQYASSIDDVVRILSYKNNGMYTNDWLMADAKTNEIAIFLLGTKKSKLWRSSTGEFPGGTKGFYWSNNNTKDDDVRKEYIANADNAPYDLVFSPWNRDIAFNQFFREYNGKIDAIAGVNLWASSPINRAHACDGKITTREMAKHMVFLAHFGKVTLRGKFIGTRYMPDKPGATPHLSLGYSIVSPVFVTEKLKALKEKNKGKTEAKALLTPDLSAVKKVYSFDSRKLWFNTVYPASNKENWFVSGTAQYWWILKRLPTTLGEAVSYLEDQLSSLNCRLLYTISREDAIAPLEARRVYDAYHHYRIPLIRGTFLLHQLRLFLGNDLFSRIMNAVHNRFKEKPMTNRQLMGLWEKTAKKKLEPFIMQWLERKTLPQIELQAAVEKTEPGWKLNLNIRQTGEPYHFFTTVSVNNGKEEQWQTIEVKNAEETVSFTFKEKPVSVLFNAGNDIPLPQENFYTFSNYFDDFHHTIFVYGTSRQIEANHSLTLRYRELLADRYTEILPPVKKDSEVSEEELAAHDLVVLGGIADNSLMERMVKKLGLTVGKNFFQWQGKTYGAADDGLFVAYPNPFNPQKTVYLVIANSALQLYRMTKQYQRLPSWALFKKDEMVKKGYHFPEYLQLKIND